MEFRQLGRSGLKVPVLSLGTGTFGGVGEFFKKWGTTDVKEATRRTPIYPYWHQRDFDERNPKPTQW